MLQNAAVLAVAACTVTPNHASGNVKGNFEPLAYRPQTG